MDKQGFEDLGFNLKFPKDVKSQIELIFKEEFGQELGIEIPFLLSEVSKTKFSKLIENPKMFENTLEKVFKKGSKELNNKIVKQMKKFQNKDAVIEQTVEDIDKSQNRKITTLFFQTDSFRDKLLEKYFLNSKENNIATLFFGKAKPTVETTSSLTYEQILGNGNILLSKVKDNISNVVLKNNSEQNTRIGCQETSIFKEKNIFDQYIKMLEGLDNIEKNITVLFCFKEKILDKEEIKEIAKYSDLIVHESGQQLFARNEI
jgi:hypothetical protein